MSTSQTHAKNIIQPSNLIREFIQNQTLIRELIAYMEQKCIIRNSIEIFAEIDKRILTDLYKMLVCLDEAIEEYVKQLKATKATNKIRNLENKVKGDRSFKSMIGNSEKLRVVKEDIIKVAETDSPVLILGEPGTGKELIAQAIHAKSHRKNKKLIVVDCASLSLIEDALFGHVSGSFTGATGSIKGYFEQADKSTIFLDEIGELPLNIQSKFLRVLQSRKFDKVGQPGKPVFIDIRIVAATNKNLKDAVKAGQFRQDLFDRLNVFPIKVPPLRERPEDIPLLVNHFLTKKQKKYQIPKEMMEFLKNYTWPGNIRELNNCIERALIRSTDNTLVWYKDDFLLEESLFSPRKTDYVDHRMRPETNRIRSKEISKSDIIWALEASSGYIEGKRGAAKKLGIPPSTFRNLMKRYGIERPSRDP